MQAEITTIEPLTPQSETGPYRAAQYFDLSEEERYELIYGRLYLASHPNIRHQTTVGLLLEQFFRIVRQSGGRTYIAPLDVVLSDHSVVQPDVIYISPENRGIIRNYIDGIPDLVVEVLSPGTARRDRSEKMQLYAESGIREYWLVDPESDHIEFLIHQADGFKVVLAQDGRYTSPIFPDIRIDLITFWQDVARFQN